MPEKKKYDKQTVLKSEMENFGMDDDMEGQEDWNPTPAQMDAYLKREVELASSNLLLTLSRSRFPQSFRDLKDASLHSVETLEMALSSHITSKKVLADKGRYSLV